MKASLLDCDSGGRASSSQFPGAEKCLERLLNLPGNFTASKLAWVKANEPEIYSRIHKVMVPGDYIALKLCGEASTTIGGLSEGMF